ncbi:proline-rich protein 2-like [Dama dama]|uniref:proline-rich protein 2-like n=1 Tax=Dama dama TaxID=30532 RepID=UPI002A35E006|nr:proline-rich protein 2-like [Dama dama]
MKNFGRPTGRQPQAVASPPQTQAAPRLLGGDLPRLEQPPERRAHLAPPCELLRHLKPQDPPGVTTPDSTRTPPPRTVHTRPSLGPTLPGSRPPPSPAQPRELERRPYATCSPGPRPGEKGGLGASGSGERRPGKLRLRDATLPQAGYPAPGGQSERKAIGREKGGGGRHPANPELQIEAPPPPPSYPPRRRAPGAPPPSLPHGLTPTAPPRTLVRRHEGPVARVFSSPLAPGTPARPATPSLPALLYPETPT